MKTWLVVAGLIMALIAAMVGCSAFLMGLAFVEPPHPSWAAPVEPPPGRGPQKTPPLSAGDYEIWIVQGGACTLHVQAGDGASIGHVAGHSCRVSGTAKPGEIWTIDATGAGPSRSVYLGKDESVFPVPLKLTAMASLVAFALGLGLMLGGAISPRLQRPGGDGGQPP